MSKESLRKALKNNPAWVERYLGLGRPSKVRARHVILFFSVIALVIGIYEYWW